MVVIILRYALLDEAVNGGNFHSQLFFENVWFGSKEFIESDVKFSIFQHSFMVFKAQTLFPSKHLS